VWQGDFPVSDDGDDGYSGTAPVAAFVPNGFGLRNVVGNVWEWCHDRFTPHQDPRPTSDPQLAARGDGTRDEGRIAPVPR
jgi:formylglycine-generating enzyme required for sulfatase activity